MSRNTGMMSPCGIPVRKLEEAKPIAVFFQSGGALGFAGGGGLGGGVPIIGGCFPARPGKKGQASVPPTVITAQPGPVASVAER